MSEIIKKKFEISTNIGNLKLKILSLMLKTLFTLEIWEISENSGTVTIVILKEISDFSAPTIENTSA